MAANARTLETSNTIPSEEHTRHRIVAILPRGEAIRNFVYTGALDEIARDVDVSLLSVVPNQDIQEQLEARFPNLVDLLEIRERWPVRFARELLDLAHGRWLWSQAARERWRLRDLEAETPMAWGKRQIKKVACYPFANRLGLRLLSKVECVLSHRARSTEMYINHFRELKPSLVFNGSHIHCPNAIQAVHAAHELGIPTATFIFSWDNLTSQGRIIPMYDYYLVWNEDIRNQLLRIYQNIRPEQVFVTGTPQFDFHFRREFSWSRKEFCSRIGADPARPIVLYTTGMANHVIGEPRVVEGVADLLKEMKDCGSPQLVVRVYPKDRTGRFDDLKQRRPDIIFPEVPWEPAWLTPQFEDAYLLANMLRHADVGINIASTISLELCMFDKPVINVGYQPPGEILGKKDFDYRRYYEFDHYRPVLESGAIEVASSEEDLRHILVGALRQPEQRHSQRLALIRQFFGNTLDGWSSTRVASVLELLLAKNDRQGTSSLRFPKNGFDSSMDYLKP